MVTNRKTQQKPFFTTLLLSLCVVLLSLAAYAVDTTGTRLTVSLFNNATLLPGQGVLGLFGVPVHPGFTAGTYFVYRQNEKKLLFQTAKLGYFYHRSAQQGIQFYSELGYRYTIRNRFTGAILAGAGYLHSIPDIEQFVMNSNGEYEKKGGAGRAQFMPSLSAEFGWKPWTGSPALLFINYQLWFQLPYVKGYVPLLPNTALHLGVQFKI